MLGILVSGDGRAALFPKGKAALHSDLADSLYRQGKLPDAVKEYEEALASNPTRTQKRHLYLYLGKVYGDMGRWDRVVDAYDQALFFDPKNWKRHRDLGIAFERAQLYKKAIGKYEDALQYRPKEKSIYVSLGRVWRKIGVYQAAEKNLNEAVRLGDQTPDLLNELSRLYEGEGHPDKAAEIFLRLLNGFVLAPLIILLIVVLPVLGRGEQGS